MSDKATLNINGETYDFPVFQSSEGELCVEISKLRGLSDGVTTLDRGFKNTASCESKMGSEAWRWLRTGGAHKLKITSCPSKATRASDPQKSL